MPAARTRLKPATAPILELTMLGGFRLRVDGRDTLLPVATQRLVALLALSRRIGRSRAAGTLWPETVEHRALASLRTSIWRVNQVAATLVSSAGGRVDVGDHVRVDVRRLAQAGLEALSPGDGASVPTDRLAIDLISEDGELLPDWGEDWLLADRERYRQLRLHLLEVVAERLCAGGHYGLAMEAALAALRSDPLRESAHRTVIRIHLGEGNLGEAHRAYRVCRSRLVGELGVEPSPMTSGLVAGRPAPLVPPRQRNPATVLSREA